MMVYNGKLYGGTLPLAKVFRFDGEGNWTDTGQLDKTPDVKYRRTWTMAIFDGKLFCGTLPSGHVYSLEVGQCVSQDRSLPPGWQHVAVVRAGNRLTLNLNGKEVSESQASRSTPPDLTNGAPLKIGFGPQDSFNGNLRDLRVYRRALSAPEILSLAAPPN